MNDDLTQTEFDRKVARRNFERGWELGFADTMRSLLRARFGDLEDLEDLAWRLAGCDYNGHIMDIAIGANLAELRILSCAQIAVATPIVLGPPS